MPRDFRVLRSVEDGGSGSGVDNRPFLRCMKGYGLCLWRLGRGDEAARVFDRMLWMNTEDNQGIRFLLPAVRDGRRWEDSAS